MKKYAIQLLILGIFLGILVSSGCRKSQAPSSPHVVMIIIDTLRADKLSCYGSIDKTSPEIDALAEKSVVFTNVVAQCSWTRPSIGSMVTSLYPRTLGIYHEDHDILADRFLTLAEILQSRGYKTVGLTANPVINASFNFHQGFDAYYDSNVIWPWMEPEEGKVVWGEENLPSAREIFTQALEIAADAENQPHYFQITTMEVHEHYLEDDKSMVRPPYDQMFLESRNPGYLQAVRQSSQDIADFISKLTALPGWDDTLFILTSDHGEGLDDHPGLHWSHYHGGYLYDTHVKVPLILYHPRGLPAARTFEKPIRLLEIMPTLLDYLGIPVPRHCIGESLMPLIRGEETELDIPPYFIMETQFRDFDKIGVYAEKWKYIENRGFDSKPKPFISRGLSAEELQRNGKRENGERTNRIANNPAVAERLKAALMRWEEKFPPSPAVKRERQLTDRERKQLKSLGYIK